MLIKIMKTGLIDDCSIMNHWKLELVNYLLKTEDKQLDCLYNCADSHTDNTGQGTTTCSSQWETGGPTTGANDVAYAGTSITSGEGTT